MRLIITMAGDIQAAEDLAPSACAARIVDLLATVGEDARVQVTIRGVEPVETPRQDGSADDVAAPKAYEFSLVCLLKEIQEQAMDQARDIMSRGDEIHDAHITTAGELIRKLLEVSNTAGWLRDTMIGFPAPVPVNGAVSSAPSPQAGETILTATAPDGDGGDGS